MMNLKNKRKERKDGKCVICIIDSKWQQKQVHCYSY
uniref:Uncharacterized protein n=1 Tax=Arundo donax TaxID=35708 RepID=A0A0A9AKM5_ARUDO